MVCRFHRSKLKPIYNGMAVALLLTEDHTLLDCFPIYGHVNVSYNPIKNSAGTVQHRSWLYDTYFIFI